MKQVVKRIILFALAAALLLSAVPVSAFAAGSDPETIEIVYSFSSDTAGTGGLLPTDKVTWRDDCFLRSSYLGCCHLAEMSAAASLAGMPYSDASRTPKENEALSPKYIKEFLSKAHFEDVETNKYYTVYTEENSAGAALGHKTIRDGDEDCTLLAVVIRSGDYFQEWAGNFNVIGEGAAGSMHAGFKAARDEVLRFAAKYMKEHGISGRLKVWITGHSRGAAISNDLGGFFAGGGDAYFRAAGVQVTVAPDDVYCYTFSSPRTVRPGLTHAEDLSVAANRSNYPNDTPGQAYTSTDTSAVDPQAACYAGIRNYPKQHDVIPKLPPHISGWDYAYYGRVGRFDSSDLAGGPVSESDMLAQLKVLDSGMYAKYTNGGSPSDYQKVTLDLDKLVEKLCSGEKITIPGIMKPTDKGPDSMGELMQQRVGSLATLASSPTVFADYDYQHALQAVAALFGMVPLDMDNPDFDYVQLAKALAFCLLDYGATRLRGTPGGNETGAIVHFLEQVLSCLFPGESIPEGSLCLTQILGIAMRYVFPRSGDTKVTKKILDLIAPKFPDPGSGTIADMLYAYLDKYVPKDRTPSSYTKAERLGLFLRACGWGPLDNTPAKDDGATARTTARDLCSLVAMAAALGYLDLPSWVTSALTDPNDPESFPGQVLKCLQAMMPEGETYTGLSAAADLLAKRAVDYLYEDRLKDLAKKGYSQEYVNAAWKHYLDAKTYIRPLRILLVTFLFTTDGEPISVEGMIRNLSLLAANNAIIAPSHYLQMDLAWAKARRAAGIWDHDPAPSPTPKPVPVTGDSATPLLWMLLVLAGLLGLGFCLIPRKASRK